MSKNKKISNKIEQSTDQVPTLQDVINAVQGGFSDVETRFGQLEASMVTKDELKQLMAEQEARLVTKDYLDEKLHDLRGDLTVSFRKEDDKVVTLVSILEQRKVLSKRDAQRVMAMDLFPRRA